MENKTKLYNCPSDKFYWLVISVSLLCFLVLFMSLTIFFKSSGFILYSEKAIKQIVQDIVRGFVTVIVLFLIQSGMTKI
jgi:hypothetical protein